MRSDFVKTVESAGASPSGWSGARQPTRHLAASAAATAGAGAVGAGAGASVAGHFDFCVCEEGVLIVCVDELFWSCQFVGLLVDERKEEKGRVSEKRTDVFIWAPFFLCSVMDLDLDGPFCEAACGFFEGECVVFFCFGGK